MGYRTEMTRHPHFLSSAGVALLLSLPAAMPAAAQQSPSDWNQPQQPFKIYGNTYYVGTHGLSAILVTSNDGHVLIDGALPESAPLIAANIRELGFRLEDVKVILNSHVHFDHAGGIAELQRLTGATVRASKPAAKVLSQGGEGDDDPQLGTNVGIAPVRNVKPFRGDEVIAVGPVQLTPHLTPGHTAGGTSWTWKSCEQARCLNLVYVDSLTAVSANNFQFTHNDRYPHAVEDFRKSFATVSSLTCDVLLTPHPDVSGFWAKVEKRARDPAKSIDVFVDHSACRRLVDGARQRLDKRIADEKQPPR